MVKLLRKARVGIDHQTHWRDIKDFDLPNKKTFTDLLYGGKHTLQRLMNIEKSKYRSENINFWYIMEYFRSLSSGISMELKARLVTMIVDVYIRDDAQYQINIDHDARDKMCIDLDQFSENNEGLDEIISELESIQVIIYKMMVDNIRRDYTNREWSQFN